MDVARILVNSALESFERAHPYGRSKVLNAFLSSTAAAYVLSFGSEKAAQVLYTIADQVATTGKPPTEKSE